MAKKQKAKGKNHLEVVASHLEVVASHLEVVASHLEVVVAVVVVAEVVVGQLGQQCEALTDFLVCVHMLQTLHACMHPC